jgi:DNA-binding MarR family transcriptional regulator
LSSKNTKERSAGTSSATLPDVLQFMQLMWAVVHGLESTSKRMSLAIGVTGPQRLVLRVVGLFPGVSAGDLASVLHVHPSTLTGVLQRLIAQKLLARTNDPADRRRAVLRLTAPGTRANAARAGTVEQAIARALAGVSAKDRQATRRVLERLAQHLDDGTPSARDEPPGAGPQRARRRKAAAVGPMKQPPLRGRDTV